MHVQKTLAQPGFGARVGTGGIGDQTSQWGPGAKSRYGSGSKAPKPERPLHTQTAADECIVVQAV